MLAVSTYVDAVVVPRVDSSASFIEHCIDSGDAFTNDPVVSGIHRDTELPRAADASDVAIAEIDTK